jgi:putative NADH-flavin reductase
MKLLVLGGTGKVGRRVVAQAIERGHNVTLLVRPSTASDVPSGARLVRGLLNDHASLDDAMRDSDAVLSSIGMQRANPSNPWSRALSEPDVTSSTARYIVASMMRCAVRRIVAVSAAGVGDSAARLNLVMRFFLATTMIGQAYEDLARMESIYADSGLDWIAPRPTRLTDESTKPIRIVERFGSLDAIARSDVARFMLDALDLVEWPAPEWRSRTPQISAG